MVRHSDNESEHGIKNKVDMIVEKNDGKGLNIQSNESQLAALLYQNLALTNELCTQIKTMNNSQDLMMQSIHQLNPIIDYLFRGVLKIDEQTLSPTCTQDVPNAPVVIHCMLKGVECALE